MSIEKLVLEIDMLIMAMVGCVGALKTKEIIEEKNRLIEEIESKKKEFDSLNTIDKMKRMTVLLDSDE